MITKISPIILFVKKYNECIRFYKEVLGLSIQKGSEPTERFATFILGDVEFSLHAGYEGDPGGPLNLHFATSDIEAEVARLKKLGVNFSQEIEKMPWGAYEAVIKDPDGNEVEIYQP